jgi:hypothetical protein
MAAWVCQEEEAWEVVVQGGVEEGVGLEEVEVVGGGT